MIIVWWCRLGFDPSHPGMSRRRLSYPVGSRAHFARRRQGIGDAPGSRRMKYLDEFRDSAKAAVLVEGDRGAGRHDRPSRRPAAAHHGSLRRPYALDLPLRRRGHVARSRSSWCTGRDARSACCRWDGSTIASPSPSRPGVIFTTFGDAMRVPGSKKSLLQAKADGADVRMVYSPMDALALARANPEPRGGVLRPRLRNHDAVDRADHPAGRGRTASRISRCSATTSPSCRQSRRSSTAPICRLDGFLGAGPCLDGDRHRAL